MCESLRIQCTVMHMHTYSGVSLPICYRVVGGSLKKLTQEHTWPGDAFAWKREAFRQAGANTGDLTHELNIILCCNMEVCMYMFGCR